MNNKAIISGGLPLRATALVYIGLLIILPICALLYEALQSGMETVWRQITVPQALVSLRLTLILAFIITFINIITGTATAWVLVRYEFPLKKAVNAIIDLPFAIPTVVTGIMLVVLYGPNSIIDDFLQEFGIEIIFNKPGIVLALLFVTFPFVVRAVQPVLMDMEREMEEAAQTLGATAPQVFIRIILPTLLPSILTGGALSLSRALGEFGSVVVVAGNIPFKTLVAPVYIYGEIESYNRAGAASVSCVLLLISFLILVTIHLLQKWSRSHASA